MTNRDAAGDSDVARGRNEEPAEMEQEDRTGIVASVGSSALGSADIEPEDKHRPDNDGETVPE